MNHHLQHHFGNVFDHNDYGVVVVVVGYIHSLVVGLEALEEGVLLWFLVD